MLGRGLTTAAAVVAVDQVSKHVVLGLFGVGACATGQIPVNSFFNVVLTCNRGVSFGLFNHGTGMNAPLFSIAAAVIVAILVYWLSRAASGFLSLAIGLIIGGAIGNVIDRVAYGGVIDFLDFHVGTWHWPAFNLADTAICLGVAAILLDGFLVRRAPPQERRGDVP